MGKKSSYKIIWSDEAIQVLDDIYFWNTEHFSINRADKILNTIKSKVVKIKRNPFMCPKYFGLVNKDLDIRMAIIASKYWLFFKIGREEIKIIDIVHTSRNPDEINLIGLN